MTAAGAAAARCRTRVLGLALDLVLRLKGRAATARRDDVRVVDREPGAHQRIDEIDFGSLEVRSAVWIDDHTNTVRLDLIVPVLRASIESEGVLEAGATATLDRDAENLGLAEQAPVQQAL